MLARPPRDDEVVLCLYIRISTAALAFAVILRPDFGTDTHLRAERCVIERLSK
jgi:hypothetical protein